MTHEIVVLSYNALEETAEAIASIQATAKGALVVIDNASENGTPAWLARQTGYRVIQRSENVKYTGAYADYLAETTADVVTLFNNDCVAEAGWEAPLLDAFRQRPMAAVVTPLLVAMDGRTVMNAGGHVDLCSHYGGVRGMHYEYPIPRLWSTGAVLSVRVSAYRALGGFDRSLLHYCSDSDLCFRAWLAGYEVWVEPRSVVRHHHQVATKQLQAKDPAGFQKLFEDQRRLNEKWERSVLRIGNHDALFEAHAEYCSGSKDVLVAGLSSWL